MLKPRAHTVIAFLFLGAFVSVLVAWTCEVTTLTQCVDLSAEAARTRRPFAVEGAWNTSTKVQEARGLGRTTIWYIGTSVGDVCIHQAGWPMRCVQYQYDEAYSAWRTPSSRGFRAAINTDPHPGVPAFLANKPLPIRPVWLGFAVNAVLWALILYLPFGGVASFIRSRRRMAKGLCPACAYPAGVSEVCTECGHAVRRARAYASTR